MSIVSTLLLLIGSTKEYSIGIEYPRAANKYICLLLFPFEHFCAHIEICASCDGSIFTLHANLISMSLIIGIIKGIYRLTAQP